MDEEHLFSPRRGLLLLAVRSLRGAVGAAGADETTGQAQVKQPMTSILSLYGAQSLSYSTEITSSSTLSYSLHRSTSDDYCCVL